MAQTNLISGLIRSSTYPVSKSVTANSNCGMLLLELGGTWTEQMISELPAINVKIFIDVDTVYSSFEINMRTVSNQYAKNPTEPYVLPIYDIPNSFIFQLNPIFDNNALVSHNANVECGNVEEFITSANGVVDSQDVSSFLWTTPTSLFDITITFDDSNVSSSGGGGGASSADNVSFNPPSDMTSTNVQDAIVEVDTKINNLPEPMIFKGSLGVGGTIQDLPQASASNKGFTYKVITAGTYQGVTAEVGDTVISDGTAWILIPSGDEPSGTVTNVAVSSADGSVTVTGSPITTSGTIDISVVTDDAFDANSTKPVQNATLTELFTPITQQQYDSLMDKDQPLYFIYEL